jgi:hypothetical protein
MQGFIVWLIFAVLVTILCLWRPNAGRLFVGLFFWLMAIAVNGTLVIINPQGFVDFANNSPIVLYRDLAVPVVEFNPRLFGITLIVFEVMIGWLLLGKDRQVRLGLMGAMVFLVGIVPLGLEEVPNVLLPLALATLLRHDFPETLWDRFRYRWRLQPR